MDLYNCFRLFFILVSFFVTSVVFCQASGKIHLTENIEAAKVSYNSSLTSLKSVFKDGVIYTISKSNLSKDRVVYSYNSEDGKIDSLIFDNNKNTKLFRDKRILSFSIVGSKFVFLCSDFIYIFKHQSNRLVFDMFVLNEFGFMNCHKFGNNILLNVCYNYHPEDFKDANVWAILNLKSNLIEHVKLLENDNNSFFGSFVNDWIVTRDSIICYARTDEYRVTFHNSAFETVDEIWTNELGENKIIVDNLKSQFDYSRDAIIELQKVDEANLTRIRKVYYLQEDVVMVLLKVGGQEIIRADYWKKKEGIWERVLIDYSSLWFEEGGSYSDREITYTDFYQNMFDLIYIGGGQFYMPYYPHIPIVETNNFNRQRDYFDKQNKVIENNEIYIGIKAIKLIDL